MKPLIGTGSPGSRTADEDLVVTRLAALAPALDGEPDPEWSARTRSRLVAMAAVRTPEPEPVSPLRRVLAPRERPLWRTRLTAGLAGAAAAVVAVAGLVTVSSGAQPGDLLYGLKRTTEQTQLALAGDARGRTLLGFASTRLDEVAAVVRDDPSADVVDDTLATMDAQTVEGAAWLAQRAVDTDSSAPLDELAGWSSGQSAGLGDLRPDVPPAASDDVDGSIDLLARIDERTEELRVALTCPAGPATAGSDELGPVPGECATAPAPPAADDPAVTTAPDASDNPSAPATDAPQEGTDQPAPEPPSGSGEGSGDGSEPGSGSGSGPGSGDPGLPQPPAATDGPGLPDLPTVPDLPTLFPGPDGTVRPPAPGSAAAPSVNPPSVSVPSLDVDVCVPPLPVVGSC